MVSASNINKKLAEMRAAGKVTNFKKKGATGEAVIFDIMHDYRSRHGGILKQGFTYPYASNRQNQIYLGNIFWDEAQQSFYDITKQLNDEIDILYISNYRVFAVEVKAYHDKSIVITDAWMERRKKRVDKSPVAQAEKHARHLYHHLYEVLPNGDPGYIIPIVCFVDESNVDDRRSAHMQEYLPVVILNNFRSLIARLDVPLGDYTLDLEQIERKLNSIERSKEV